ncbi:MAG: polysaccharide deacetylase family protein, partial [Bacillota bacterium]
MFHHFHGKEHPQVQGSISKDDFENILNFIGLDNILTANKWYKKAKNNNLEQTDICITFDDGLKCQFDIARPILNKYGLTAFYFFYTSIFTDNPSELEIYRNFRTTQYKNIDCFYDAFRDVLKQKEFYLKYKKRLNEFNPTEYLKKSPFYSDNDKWFRFLRDELLSKEQYDEIMNTLIKEKNYNISNVKDMIWMNKSDLIQLKNEDNIIGLHTHHHPTNI